MSIDKDYEPTTSLRYVLEDGIPVLQQRWLPRPGVKGAPYWRDIELVDGPTKEPKKEVENSS